MNQISWNELGQVKLLLYRSTPPLNYSKPTLKLIKKWLINIDLDNNCLDIECNRKIADEYNKLFILPEFKIFNRGFTLFKNENTVSKQKEEFIEKYFFISKDKLSTEYISAGKSRLAVNLELKKFATRKLVELYREIFNLM